jgi:hypothetical protein
MRLLYYFPRQATPIIADRLRGLQVHSTNVDVSELSSDGEMDAYVQREITNRVRTVEFVKAVAWCTEPAIQTELVGICRRTTDSQILLAALPAIDQEHRGLVRDRLESFLRRLPETERGPYGDGYHLLVALGKHFAAEVRPAFEQYLVTPGVQRRRSMSHALREIQCEWTIDLLVPLLEDKRPAEGWTYSVIPETNEPRLPIRVCDEAAETISLHHSDLPFRLGGTHSDLDRQIKAIQERIRRKQK